MVKSVIGILLGIIIFLTGLVISILESFGTDIFWTGLVMLFAGIGIVTFFVLSKSKHWF